MYRQMRNTPGGEPIPENYSGNAFRYPPIGSLEPMPPEREPQDSDVPPEHEQPSIPGQALVPSGSARVGEGGSAGGLFHSPGSEEWLLLGLCLLFWGESSRSDLLPYLLLLLFLG